MKTSSKKYLRFGQTQLDILSVALLVLLGVSAWHVARPLTGASVVPLALIGYVMLRIVFELTLNRKNVPTLATGFAGRGKMTEILRQEVAQHQGAPYTIIDLGSGRGELTRHIARALPQAQVIGIEQARIPFWQSRMMQRWFGPANLSYQGVDFFPFDCSKVDAVVFYLSGVFAQRVGEKLHRELKAGSLVISHTFPLLGAWTPTEVLHFRSPFKETIYVYRKA